jgi:hypothetical protein
LGKSPSASTIETAVSSHEVSIDRMIIGSTKIPQMNPFVNVAHRKAIFSIHFVFIDRWVR